jgi:hypothetical protein
MASKEDINLPKIKDTSEKLVCDDIQNTYNKKCTNNELLLKTEEENSKELAKNPNKDQFLYPNLNDPNFNIKISQKKEFSDTRYDGTIYNVKDYADILAKAEYELLPQQAFVRNFMSFQTPYNSLLLFHGLGSGKTCSAIGVCEEMRDYLKQMGISKPIIIVASPNVQDNFRLQLFDERKLKLVDGIWTMKGCLGNKLLKEINPTGMKGLKKEKVIQQVKNLINASYHFVGYLQFSNEIVKNSGSPTLSIEAKIRNLQNTYDSSLIVIDEVHNIRISGDNENKNVAKNLTYLISVVNNIRLLLLSATPMFNSYNEIIWLLNLMNMNDRRGIVSVRDIFTKDGEFKKNKDGEETGKDLLIKKATGYISYVRGENPYTFPFRVYPNNFAPSHTFQSINEYPQYQINGRKIPDERKIQKLNLFLTPIGEYQQLGYSYIIDSLRRKKGQIKTLKSGKTRKISEFEKLKSFGYTDLQIPIESLNIIYPYPELEKLAKKIKKIKHSDEVEEDILDISPMSDIKEKDVIDEIEEVITSGPKINTNIKSKISNEMRSEIESEPIITEGIDGDEKMFNKVTEINKNVISHITSSEIENLKHSNTKNSSNSFGKTIVSKKDTKSIGGNDEDLSGDDNDDDTLFINSKELTGIEGLKRIMNFIDSKTPAIKGEFEYKKGVEHIFEDKNIGKYSSKIKNICNYIYNKKTKQVSDGIILIYSSYIDAGLIPMALALEEMGFIRAPGNNSLFKTPPTQIVDVRTMEPPTNKKDFKPARYAMITGDPRLSFNNDLELKGLTNDDNINGENIKVVLISQAGSEGLDFKAIRQIHILEPWYNINRIEQIIGRGVRNFSHKDLPFEKRNVQIFLYGTILKDAEEEAADLYIYRISELKAVKIGKVTRLLKQTSVDCLINHDQTLFTNDNFSLLEENRDVVQILSDHTKIENFQIGDLPNSATCDFMESCEFKCLPDKELDESLLNYDTYNQTFMLINSEKIIQKIKTLMKLNYFYNKQTLFQLINTPKKYPVSQIYASLTQIINDKTEYIVDKYGRTGYLINIGDYYLFQPSEINYDNISIYDRSIPIDYKHKTIKFEMKNELAKPVIDKRNLQDAILREEVFMEEYLQGEFVLNENFNNYKTALETTKVVRGIDNWYQHCGVVIRKMKDEGIKLDILEQFLIEHICDCLMMKERIDLLNYLNNNPDLETKLSDPMLKRFVMRIKKYFLTKILVAKGLTGMIIFDGPSRIENVNIFILKNNVWTPAEPEDKKDLSDAIHKKYKKITNLNKFVGFIGFETNKKYMIYKVKNTENERTTGFRCDQSGKNKIMSVLNEIEDDEKYISKITKEGGFELCVRQEFTLRYLEYEKTDDKTWFLDTEMAIINEFEKKEKPN